MSNKHSNADILHQMNDYLLGNAMDEAVLRELAGNGMDDDEFESLFGDALEEDDPEPRSKEREWLASDEINEKLVNKFLIGDICQVVDPHNPFPLLRLPTELRLHVYKLLLSIDPVHVQCDLYSKEKHLHDCKDQHRYNMDDFRELNTPLGYFKPFTDPSSVKFSCYARNGHETEDYWYPDSRHVEYHQLIQNVCLASKQLYAEVRPLHFEENMFLDLESDASRVALWKLRNRIPQTSRIRRLHLLVRSNVFVRGHLADTIFTPEGKRRWINKHGGSEWRPLATHSIGYHWRCRELAELNSRFVAFEIRIVDDGRGIEIRAPCALSTEHATKLEAYVKYLVEHKIDRLDGHDLIRLAAHLSTPMFTHPELWHQRKPPSPQNYHNWAPRVICADECESCHELSGWDFEAKEEDIEILDDWIVGWEELHREPSPSTIIQENYPGYRYVEVVEVKLRQKVKVKDERSHVLVRATIPVVNVSSEGIDFESWVLSSAFMEGVDGKGETF